MLMSKQIDPIEVLKEHITHNKKIDKHGEYLVFSDGLKLKLNTPTAFIQSQSDKKQYTLGSLWFYLKHRNDPLSVYKTELMKERIETVVGIDKDPIIDFFINDNSDVKIIDEDLRQKTLIFLGKKKHSNEPMEKIIERENQNEEQKESNKLDRSKDKSSRNKSQFFSTLEPELRIMDYIYTKQKHSLNRNSSLRPVATQLSGFENLLSICRRTFVNTNKANSRQNETKSFLDELSQIDDLKGNKAIIIVPVSTYPGNLVLENAKQFLVNSVYVDPSSEEIKLNASDKSLYTFTRNISGKEMSFEIHSNVRNFSRNDWKRVVAVFVQGSDWEFSDWPKGESVTSILQKIKGFHLKYSDLPTNENIKKWNVKVLEINRFKRHFDVSVQNEFWNALELFLNQPRYREKINKHNN